LYLKQYVFEIGNIFLFIYGDNRIIIYYNTYIFHTYSKYAFTLQRNVFLQKKTFYS